ncbi:Ff.00g012530.m01.CDS01 [Fusarium sp. VM40]|nr:Ff.00g012530.m01.CDS01 [Fusarium sp. VM40]
MCVSDGSASGWRFDNPSFFLMTLGDPASFTSIQTLLFYVARLDWKHSLVLLLVDEETTHCLAWRGAEMSLATAIRIIRTLPADKVYKLLKEGGPVALTLLQFWNQRGEGKAARQQELTLQDIRDALPKLLSSIQSREIRVVPNAFNAAPTFLTYFEAAALGSIPLVLLDLSSAIKRVGASLDAIRSELEISNVARVQGWNQGGFGGYIHRFVQNEMSTVNGTKDDQHHFFYVWHPDSDWYPAFEERQAQHPLGPAFGGYDHDLATICVRMRADREALIETTDYGRTAMLHLVIPAYYPLVIDRPIAFADELLPLTVTGSRHRGTDLVWFALRHDMDEVRLLLNFVGVLPDDCNIATKVGLMAYLGSGAAGWVSGVGSLAFPPLVLIAYPLCFSTVASWAITVAGRAYDDATREATQILGDPIFLR